MKGVQEGEKEAGNEGEVVNELGQPSVRVAIARRRLLKGLPLFSSTIGSMT